MTVFNRLYKKDGQQESSPGDGQQYGSETPPQGQPQIHKILGCSYHTDAYSSASLGLITYLML